MAGGPELPYLAAGGLSLAGGALKEGKWPAHALTTVIATATLVVFASATGDTKLAPLVRAIGVLFCIAALYGVVRAAQAKKKAQ